MLFLGHFWGSLLLMARPSVALLLGLLLAYSTLSAPALPKDEPECAKQGMGKLELADEDLTILGLTIGRASLKDVETKLGLARSIQAHGDATASRTICYVSPADGTVLEFGAGPMGGFTDVTEFEIWSREAKFPNASACRPSTLVHRGISTKSGIRLGLTLDELNKIVGKNPKARDSVAQYELLCRRKMTPEEIKAFKTRNNWDVSASPYFDMVSTVEAHFAGSGASRIMIYKGESY
jgi:hypothetical protein